MYKVFSYRLYPTNAQLQRMERTRETCRRWYNQCLEERKTAYEERKQRISRFDQIRRVTEFRATDPAAAQIPHNVLQDVVDHLDRAFQAFFRRMAAGEKAGYPRFKGAARYAGFGYKQLGHGFKVDGRRLRLTGIGRVAVRWHRPLEGKIKTLRVVQKAGKWYAYFACEVAPQPLPPTGREIGIDVGIASLITTSDGEQVAHPNWYRREQRRLRVLQRRVSRRKLGGSNRRKAVRQLQRQHARITNRRKDFLNKLVHNLIGRYDRIALEKLRIRNMVKNRHLSKSILDAGWGYLIEHLASKAAEAGRVVCLVDPAHTSKTCSQCGRALEGVTLKTRQVSCACGMSLDRDLNAAINVLNRAGQVRWALSSSPDGLAQAAVDP